MQVRRGIKIEQRIGPQQLNPGHGLDQGRLVFCRRDAFEFGRQGRHALGVNRRFVYAGTVVVADFLADGIATRAGSRGFLQDLAHDRGISLPNLDKAHPGSLVRRNYRRLQPVATGILVEIHTGIDGLVDGVEIDHWLRSGLAETGYRQQQERLPARKRASAWLTSRKRTVDSRAFGLDGQAGKMLCDGEGRKALPQAKASAKIAKASCQLVGGQVFASLASLCALCGYVSSLQIIPGIAAYNP